MATNKELKQKAIATVDAAITILNKYPQLKNTDTDLSYNLSTNPFDLLLDLFQHTEGYNVLIQIISSFIGIALPIVEVEAKAVLIAYLKKFLSCSLNPFITDDILRDGVVCSIRDIDLTDKLFESPLSTVGKYYYFGCDDYTITDEVKNSKDFDCLLWYMKNKATHREVWGKKTGLTENWEKQTKKDGIVTLEYSERSSGLSTADGNGLNLQTPYGNCIHVFIGNTKEVVESNTDLFESEINAFTNLSTKARELIDTINLYISNVDDELINLDDDYNKGMYKEEVYLALRQHYWEQRDAFNILLNLYSADGKGSWASMFNQDSLDNLTSALNDIEKADVSAIRQDDFDYDGFCNPLPDEFISVADILYYSQAAINRRQIDAYNVTHPTSSSKYRSIQKNYYYRHTILEFNYDYVMSLKLFDSKVIAAQLIDSLTGLLKIDLNLDIKRQIIREEVEKMVQMVVESDDTVVSDCFFSFSNDEYDAMVQKAEMTKAGLYAPDGEEYIPIEIDAEALLESLNGLSDDASEEEVVSIISGAITDLSKNLTETTESTKTTVSFGVNMNFIERLLNNLAYVIVLSILSPKIYLLLKVNLEIVGQSTNYSLKDFIDIYKQMLVSLIRSIRDQLLKYLMAELLKTLGTLAAEIGSVLRAEQAAYFMTLIRLLLAAFRKHKNTIDWTQDDVDYADIYPDEEGEETESTNAEC